MILSFIFTYEISSLNPSTYRSSVGQLILNSTVVIQRFLINSWRLKTESWRTFIWMLNFSLNSLTLILFTATLYIVSMVPANVSSTYSFHNDYQIRLQIMEPSQRPLQVRMQRTRTGTTRNPVQQSDSSGNSSFIETVLVQFIDSRKEGRYS